MSAGVRQRRRTPVRGVDSLRVRRQVDDDGGPLKLGEWKLKEPSEYGGLRTDRTPGDELREQLDLRARVLTPRLKVLEALRDFDAPLGTRAALLHRAIDGRDYDALDLFTAAEAYEFKEDLLWHQQRLADGPPIDTERMREAIERALAPGEPQGWLRVVVPPDIDQRVTILSNDLPPLLLGEEPFRSRSFFEKLGIVFLAGGAFATFDYVFFNLAARTLGGEKMPGGMLPYRYWQSLVHAGIVEYLSREFSPAMAAAFQAIHQTFGWDLLYYAIAETLGRILPKEWGWDGAGSFGALTKDEVWWASWTELGIAEGHLWSREAKKPVLTGRSLFIQALMGLLVAGSLLADGGGRWTLNNWIDPSRKRIGLTLSIKLDRPADLFAPLVDGVDWLLGVFGSR
jgi:hypothetical protein